MIGAARLACSVALAAIAAFAAIAAVLPFTAAAQEQVSVQAWDNGSHGRILFRWPEAVAYAARVVDNELLVTFERPFTADLSAVPARLGSYVLAAVGGQNATEARFRLRADYRLRAFDAGPSVVLDLYGTESEAPAAPPAGPAAPPVASEPPPTTEMVALDAALSPGAGEPTLPLGSNLDPVTVRVGRHDTYNRVVFDWPGPVGYRVERLGARVAVSFDRPALADIEGAYIDTAPAVTVIDWLLHDDGLTVFLDIPPGAGIRDFQFGERTVIDVFLTPEDAERDSADAAPVVAAEPVISEPVAAPPEPAPAAAAEAPVEAVEAPAEATEAPPEFDAASIIQPLLDEPSPAADQDDELESLSDELLPAIDNPMVEVPAPAAAAAPAALPDDPLADLDMALPATSFGDPPSSAPQAAAGSQAAGPVGPAVTIVPVEAVRTEAGIHVRFRWPVAAAATVFVRAQHLWAAFDVPVRLAFDIAEDSESVLRDAFQIEAESGTVARFSLAPGFQPSVTKEDNDWLVDLSPERGQIDPLIVSVNPKADGQGAIFIPEFAPGTVLHVADPSVGDELILIPISSPGKGVLPARRFVQLALLDTAQGVAARAHSDDLAVHALRNGISFSSLAEMHLSVPDAAPDTATEDLASQTVDPELEALVLGRDNTLDDEPIFDFDGWRRLDNMSFRDSHQKMNLELSLSPEETRNQHRLQLARFHFANLRSQETIGWLDRLIEGSPWLTMDRELQAQRGAALFLLGRHDDAADHLFAEQFDNNQEIALWRGAYFTAQGDHENALEAFTLSGRVIDRYPRRLRADFQLMFAASAVDQKRIDLARSIIDRVLVEDPPRRVVERGLLLRGLAEVAAERPSEALEYLVLAAASGDRELHARAERARVDLMLAQNSMTPEEATDVLERLRYVWRGEGFEEDLLRQLGDLYVGSRRYETGLSTYREAITLFPDSPTVREMTQAMNGTFAHLFVDGGADDLPPITALAIYYGFRELTPAGPQGDDIVFRLAERMVGVDLLDDAADLLQHQVDFRLHGEPLARVGARLAEIYLLNQDPEQAVAALRASDVVDLESGLADERRHLLSRALIGSGDYDAALQLVRGDQGEAAERIRIDVYWAQKDWLAEATMLARAFRNRDAELELTANERQDLLRFAVALALSNNRAGLSDVRQRFGEAMAGSPEANAFDALAAYVDGGRIDFDEVSRALAGIDTYERFVTSLRERMAEDGLNPVN